MSIVQGLIFLQLTSFFTDYWPKKVGRLEHAIGWYHSHPGYGCWLSGIDVSTQMVNQNYQEPFVAIVIDPVRTISAGKVNLGAFRTYPKGYKPSDEYYALDVTYFKSSLDGKLLDSLWNKYWLNTLSSSPLLTVRDLVWTFCWIDNRFYEKQYIFCLLF